MNIHYPLYPLIFFISLLGSATSWALSCAELPDSECAALEAFYQATGGEQWLNKDNWLTDEPLEQWYGVSVADGHVAALILDDNGLTGQLPDELGQLSHLGILSLANNQLSGALPAALCELPQLETLQLKINDFNGAIPSCLGDLKVLNVLSLRGNKLTGAIPETLCQLEHLEELSLAQNQLGGQIPECLGDLAQLKILYLSNNALSGQLPKSFSKLKQIRQLYVDSNKLKSPSIDKDFIQMAFENTDFIQFHIHYNRLSEDDCSAMQRLMQKEDWQSVVPGWPEGGFLNSDQTYIREFKPPYCPPLEPELTVTKVGEGTVISSDNLISCGDDCTEVYGPDDEITLTATPADGFKFTVWGDGCQGTETTTTVKMDAHKTCTAYFKPPLNFSCNDVGIPETECQALITFFESTGGDSWNEHVPAGEKWFVADNEIANWYGLTVEDGHVVEMNLDTRKDELAR